MNEFEKAFLQANLQEKAMGFHWYLDSHNYLEEMAKFFKKPLPLVCGIVAVLSPGMSWSANVNLAYQLIKGKGSVGHMQTKPSCYGLNLKKAQRMLKTGKVFPYLHGPKVEQFYLNLFEPMSPHAITIDSFMIACYYRCMTTDKGIIQSHSTEKEIGKLKHEIRILADKYDLLPLQFQATVWIVFHRVLKSMTSYSGQMFLKIF